MRRKHLRQRKPTPKLIFLTPRFISIKMKISLLLLAALSVNMLFHMSLKEAQASVVNELLDDEISVLGEEIEKRSSRKPCGFTWRCRRRSKRRGRSLQKRDKLSQYDGSFSRGHSNFDEALDNDVIDAV
ncbi:uncharacterized protein [Montipora foliosa]|uniref:uncharacterized protein isoform X2 n=1 Tax=Montipora foliosa TaxID=591990 RepID=UPI0035F1038B